MTIYPPRNPDPDWWSIIGWVLVFAGIIAIAVVCIGALCGGVQP